MLLERPHRILDKGFQVAGGRGFELRNRRIQLSYPLLQGLNLSTCQFTEIALSRLAKAADKALSNLLEYYAGQTLGDTKRNSDYCADNPACSPWTDD